MKNGLLIAGGAGIGAGLMFLLDPQRGNRRRAIARDKAISALHKASNATRVAARDLASRTYGTAASLGSVFGSDHPDDRKLLERVRSKIGRFVSHPSAIEVEARGGIVSLRGPILAREVDAMLAATRGVRGVTSVENHLEVHETAENVPELQGGRPRPGARIDILQTHWSPATRLLVGAGGGALALAGASRRGLAGTALAVAGVGLAARAATNRELRRLVGVTLERKGEV
jgi:hypothetical protein